MLKAEVTQAMHVNKLRAALLKDFGIHCRQRGAVEQGGTFSEVQTDQAKRLFRKALHRLVKKGKVYQDGKRIHMTYRGPGG